MEHILTVCKCGSKEFSIEETTTATALVDEKGNLKVDEDTRDSMGINLITCMECGDEKKISEFNSIL